MDPVTGTAMPIGPARTTSRGRVVQVRASGMGQLATAIVALVGVLAFVRFLWTKVEFNTEATGWVFLPTFMACCVFVAAAQLAMGARVAPRRSSVMILVFMLYFCVRLVSDADTGADVIGYTLGYTEGVIFGYGAGVLVRLLLDALGGSGSRPVRWLSVVLLLSMNLWLLFGIEQRAQDEGRFHRLYNLVESDTYQTSGALSSIIMIITWSSVLLVMDGSSGLRSRVARAVLLLVAVAVSGAAVRMGQLLGSNAGPVFVGVASALAVAIAVVPLADARGRRMSASASTGPGLRREVWFVGLVVLAIAMLLAVAFALAVGIGAMDVSRYRFFGFEEASAYNSSMESRLRILEQNFGDQFAHAPVFGDFFVDRATTGDGTYAHSLIAVFPHLGLFGAALFVAMVAAVCSQLRRQWAAAQDGAGSRRFALFAVWVVTWVLAFMAASTFFTNVLLWFSLGLFAPGSQLSRFRSGASAGVPSPAVSP
jgi:hypothetical protein